MQVDQTGMIISSVPRRCIISSAARAECAQKHTIRYANASRDFEFVATGAFRAIFDRVHVLAVPVTLLLVLAVLLVLGGLGGGLGGVIGGVIGGVFSWNVPMVSKRFEEALHKRDEMLAD